MHTQLCGKQTVIGIGTAAPEHMSRYAYPGVNARGCLHLCRNPAGGSQNPCFCTLLSTLLFLQLGFLHVKCALSHCHNGKALTVCRTLQQCLADLFNVIGDLRNQDNIRTAGNACAQGQPASLVPHDLTHQDPGMACCRGMQPINGIRVNIHCGLIAEGHIRAINIVVDGLGQTDYVQPLLCQQVGGLVGAVAPKGQQAVQLLLFVGFLHILDLVHVVLPDDGHHLEGLPLGTQNGAPLGQNTGKIRGIHIPAQVVDQAIVTVGDPHDLYLVRAKLLEACLGNATNGGVQSGAVPAAC